MTTTSGETERLQRLAGGLAHDLNNLLNAFVGYGELLRAALPAAGELLPYAEGIVDASRRGTGLSRQLAVLGGRILPRLRATDLAQLLPRCVDASQIPPAVALPAAACPVHADPDLLVEAVANAIAHVRRCLPHGGLITLALDPGRLALELHLGAPLPVVAGASLCEPYRSAGPGLKGGLGLAVAAELARLAGGALEPVAGPDGGCLRFVCQPPPPAGSQALAGRTLVLVVADGDLRADLERHLAAAGATVLVGDDLTMAEGLVRVLAVPVDALVADHAPADGVLAGVRRLVPGDPAAIAQVLAAG